MPRPRGFRAANRNFATGNLNVGFAQIVGLACRAGPSWFLNVEDYQGPFRQKGPTTDFLGEAPE
jgi:hypothetical protein